VRPSARRLGWLAIIWLAACAGSESKDQAASEGASGTVMPGATCPERATAPALPPGTKPEHMQLAYWLAREGAAELDRPIMSAEEVQLYDRAVGRAGDAVYSQRDLSRAAEPARVRQELSERLQFLRERVSDGRFVDSSDAKLPGTAQEPFSSELPALAPSLRVALGVVSFRCGPFAGPLYEHKQGAALNTAYDRNACSAAHEQEVIEVLADWPGGMKLARTRYAIGWIDAGSLLSPPIPATQRALFVNGPRARAAAATELTATSGEKLALPKHATVPLLPNGRVLVGDARRFHEAASGALEPTLRPLTRRALLTTAFQFMDSPYGFGDARGGRDCSRLQMDVFESFDLALPRHSGWQAQAGTFSVDVGDMSANDKLRALDQAAASGAVLLAFPGHIMLYLGKNDAGTPMALHALGEYVVPCAGGKGESVLDVQRTVVSDLQLGAGSSRHSLLERIATLVVIGKPTPAPELAARANVNPLPPATGVGAREECKDSEDARVFVSPARPMAKEPLRLIATRTGTTATALALWVYDESGALVAADMHRLNGPPQAAWTRVVSPVAGRYTALFMDGTKQIGCKRVTVHDGAIAATPPEEGPIWKPRRAWERDTMNLWSAFVEQIFDGPPDDEQTWTSLHALLRDPARNILLNHLGKHEDDAFELVPDCADLPYSLRAYFAWKLGLPFAYRQCARGKPGVPPTCGPLITDLTTRDDASTDDVSAFAMFVNRRVRAGVHSATGRTHPDDSDTDLYPVALERAVLPPGTVYADPYGHVMIVAKWFPQGRDPNAYGILMAAEAQPDGTVGRRRFFPGSFLFDPSTKDAGAGFKQFRPLIYDARAKEITTLDNAALAVGAGDFARFSKAQYEGSKDDFYEQMDRIINPAPLDAHVRLKSLIDALEESVRRRVLSIDNAEKYWAEGPHGTISMPLGYEIFETEGAWEDFATPSRDMRLLIALDTVQAVPAQVEKFPDRFKLQGAEQAKRMADELRADFGRELKARTFTYTKSDGSTQTLTLEDVLQRSDAIETAYNPNDCVESRWGAPEGSPELASCRRHAPPEQRTRMLRYRAWFHARTRPPRGTTG
jgi:hypothetical protein